MSRTSLSSSLRILNALLLLSASLIFTLVLYQKANTHQQSAILLIAQDASVHNAAIEHSAKDRNPTQDQNLRGINGNGNTNSGNGILHDNTNTVNGGISHLSQELKTVTASYFASLAELASTLTSSSSTTSSSGTTMSGTSSVVPSTTSDPSNRYETDKIRALALFQEMQQLLTKTEQSLEWISNLSSEVSPDSSTNIDSIMRFDKLSNADIHILHKIHSYLKHLVTQSSRSESALLSLLSKTDNEYQCTPLQREEQEVIAKHIKMDICSEIEWYKVINLVVPWFSSIIDVGGNKGYLGSLFAALWNHQSNVNPNPTLTPDEQTGSLNTSPNPTPDYYPLRLYNYASKGDLYRGSRNPAGYCRDGLHYGTHLYCPDNRMRDRTTGLCMIGTGGNPNSNANGNANPNPNSAQSDTPLRIYSFDGSSYLASRVTSMIQEMKCTNPNPTCTQWTYLHLALSDSQGTARFTKQTQETNAGFEGGKIRPLSVSSQEEDTTEVVNLTSVDLFVQGGQHPLGPGGVEMLKIDAEGNDNKVILGADRTLSSTVKVLTFEGGGGVTFGTKEAQWLSHRGFSCYSTSRAGLFFWGGSCMPEKFFGNFRAKDKGNIFCVNRQRAPLLALVMDALTFPVMSNITSSSNPSANPNQPRDLNSLLYSFVNIRPYCKPWPRCVRPQPDDKS